MTIILKDLSTGKLKEVSVQEILDMVNNDRSEGWENYDKNDWREGWNEWREGDSYTLVSLNEKPKEKQDRVVGEALEAFWNIVVENYPEIQNADFPHSHQIEFERVAGQMIHRWKDGNTKVA